MTKRRYDNIQMWRIVAVLAVVLTHIGQRMNATGHLATIVTLGETSVELFFIISGFLAIRYFDTPAKPNKVKRYYLKRAVRLLPLFYFVVIYFYITETFIFKDVPSDPSGLGWWRYVLPFFVNIRSGDTFYNFWTNLGMTWTISIFATFFLFMPIIAKLVKNYRSAVVFVVAMWMLRVIMTYRDMAYMHTLAYFVFFAMGILLWYAEKEEKQNHFMAFIAIILAVNLVFKKTILEFDYLIIATICFSLLILATMTMKINSEPVKKILSTIDKYSYSIYLCQGITFLGIIDKMNNPSKPVIIIIAVFGTALISFLVYQLVEKPIQTWLLKRIDEKYPAVRE